MNNLASILGAIYVLSETALSIAKRARSGEARLADGGSRRKLPASCCSRPVFYMERTQRLIPGIY